MKLLDLQISGFGKFHDRSIQFSDGLNIIYGKNEAGKSTLHTFIRAMLFGMERQRGRAAKTDQFSKYRPWDLKGGYEGRLRLESQGHIYRIHRNFQNPREFTIVDETEGKQVEPTKAFMDRLLCGLNETAYVNTISIGQLKSATDSGMASELKNYIANMNTTGNMALNITKASAFLKAQRKEMERQLAPEAARTYTNVLGEIRNLEKEISGPEYENHLTEFQAKQAQAKKELDQLRTEREELLQKIARGHQVLESSQFTDEASIEAYESRGKEIYQDYSRAKVICEKPSRKAAPILLFLFALILGAGGGGLMLSNASGLRSFPLLGGGLLLTALILAGAAVLLLAQNSGRKKDMDYSKKLLQEIFSRHLGDNTVSQEGMNAFLERMAEFKRLCRAVISSQETANTLEKNMEELSRQQSGFGAEIETQQKRQWELEKKLEHLASLKTQAEGLREVIQENERVSQELAAIDLAQDTMTELASSIRNSFGLYLNKEASDLIKGITGGIYNSMSVDENLNVFMNTKTKLVPMDQVSSGTLDQIYLALRLAAARLIQSGPEKMPLIFDDSFALYDDDRLRSALCWLASAFSGQIILFTCHRREEQILKENHIPFHFISI